MSYDCKMLNAEWGCVCVYIKNHLLSAAFSLKVNPRQSPNLSLKFSVDNCSHSLKILFLTELGLMVIYVGV